MTSWVVVVTDGKRVAFAGTFKDRRFQAHPPTYESYEEALEAAYAAWARVQKCQPPGAEEWLFEVIRLK